MKRPPRSPGEPFEIRHADNPLGADYDIVGDCWIWKWQKHERGYARARIDGKFQRISRWLLRDQLTTEKPYALHKPGICHNPACINIDHLYAGNNYENMADTFVDGTANFGIKLTVEQVQEIYRRAWSGLEKQKDIAADYGVTRGTVGHIKQGRRCARVPSISSKRP